MLNAETTAVDGGLGKAPLPRQEFAAKGDYAAGLEAALIYVAFYAFLGEPDRAFEWLERSYLERSYSMTGIRVQPVVDSLRGDPRFAEMLHTMKLE